MSTVFRVEKNREFVVMSNRFLRNKEMSLKAKGLLATALFGSHEKCRDEIVQKDYTTLSAYCQW